MDLNLRNVPEELVRTLKSTAAVRGLTLREHCISVLEGNNDRNSKRDDVGRVHVSDKGRAVGGGRNDASVPVLPKAKGSAKHVHSVQSVRDELVQGSGHHETSSCEAAGHQLFRSGDGWFCATCGQ